MEQNMDVDPLCLIQTHKLSYINGLIKRMKADQLRKWLQLHGQNVQGHKDVIAKRLRALVKREVDKLRTPTKMNNAMLLEVKTRFYFVMDIEATCEEPLPDGYPHEIIELPIIVVDAESHEIVSEFRELCRPLRNPKLTDFCTQLTGITQAEVDKSDTFSDVFPRLAEFLRPFLESPCILVTDSPYDVYRFLMPACQQHGIKFPQWGRSWINVRKIFSYFYKTERMNLAGMLNHLGLEFDGRPHCGLDDAKNIARVLITLLNDGCIPMPNEGLTKIAQSSISNIRNNSNLPLTENKLVDQLPKDSVRKIDFAMLNLKI